ncbi:MULTISPECIES: DUF5361 domain-containing protein [Actinomycetes]|uniref:DUF5361 domain-containing protein n=1 Tax=Micromonospora sp. NPDC005367 TaxID=3155590 RepID=UPI0033BA2C80
MAHPFGDQRGGILGLVGLINKYREAIESDLIDRGLRLRWLGTESLTWVDLRSIIACLGPESALGRAMNPLPPEEREWGLTEHLIAHLVDLTNLLWWAQTKDGQNNMNRPSRIPRPGIKDDVSNFGDEPMPISEMDDYLGWGDR